MTTLVMGCWSKIAIESFSCRMEEFEATKSFRLVHRQPSLSHQGRGNTGQIVAVAGLLSVGMACMQGEEGGRRFKCKMCGGWGRVVPELLTREWGGGRAATSSEWRRGRGRRRRTTSSSTSSSPTATAAGARSPSSRGCCGAARAAGSGGRTTCGRTLRGGCSARRRSDWSSTSMPAWGTGTLSSSSQVVWSRRSWLHGTSKTHTARVVALLD